jgi:hypothetical protein
LKQLILPAVVFIAKSNHLLYKNFKIIIKFVIDVNIDDFGRIEVVKFLGKWYKKYTACSL